MKFDVPLKTKPGFSINQRFLSGVVFQMLPPSTVLCVHYDAGVAGCQRVGTRVQRRSVRHGEAAHHNACKVIFIDKVRMIVVVEYLLPRSLLNLHSDPDVVFYYSYYNHRGEPRKSLQTKTSLGDVKSYV